ncbi:uncharacterized protein L201_007517 [Kwoniella dendrophila CBS 6074]|uniref:DUF1279 domain-containing protein n=1 Tax=Kwoniella dendrophila CBS 6074 TaxID=1295534 RepID=A0AAX4K5W5_9TREE
MSTLPVLRSTFASSSRSTLIRSLPRIVSPYAAKATSFARPLSSQSALSSLRVSRRNPISFQQFSTTPIKRNVQSTSSTSQSKSSSTTSTNANTNKEGEGQEEEDGIPKGGSVTARLKILFKKYGWYALGIYTILSTIDCSLTFLAVHTLGADKIEPIFDGLIQYYRKLRFGQDQALILKKEDEEKRLKEEIETQLNKLENSNKNKNGEWFGKTFWAELALAYAIHKTLLLPVRAGLTVAWTPKIVNWLASRGWVGKGGLTRAANHAQGKVKDASERVKDRVKRQ